VQSIVISVSVYLSVRSCTSFFDSGPFVPSCENMTSSTKPEVHNVLHCRQKRTEPQPQVTCQKM